MVYRQLDNPTSWSRRGSELPVIPEQNNPGPSSGEKTLQHQKGKNHKKEVGKPSLTTMRRPGSSAEGRGMALRGRRGNSGSGTTGCRGGTLRTARGNQDQIKATAGDGGNQAAEGPGVGEPYGSGPRGKQHYRECPIASAF